MEVAAAAAGLLERMGMVEGSEEWTAEMGLMDLGGGWGVVCGGERWD